MRKALLILCVVGAAAVALAHGGRNSGDRGWGNRPVNVVAHGLSTGGGTLTGDLTLPAAGTLFFDGRSNWSSPADNQMMLSDSAKTAANQACFVTGVTANYLDLMQSDCSTALNLRARNILASNHVGIAGTAAAYWSGSNVALESYGLGQLEICNKLSDCTPSGILDIATNPNTLTLLQSDGTTPLDLNFGTATLAEYERHIDINIGSVGQGVTSPTETTIGTAGCLTFNADAEHVLLTHDMPDDWSGGNITLNVHWAPESAMADGETVKWDIQYRAIEEGETLTNGDVAEASATYTQSGAGTQYEFLETSITLLAADPNQPLTANDEIPIHFDRDMTGDTFAGDACVVQWHLAYNSTMIPTH
jgi:hypothetical protein